MDLVETGENFGTLNLQPVMLLLKYQGMPENGKGTTGHLEFGGGINYAEFDKGPFLTNMENSYNITYTIATDDAFIFEMGGGLDYFFNKNFSALLDLRFLMGNIDTTWSQAGSGGTVNIQGIDNFFVSTFQVLLGVRCWF